ncbi:hypothetical protein MUO71_05445 [Candidatus Bathyarchaeota archaeon]|nr:hypothetical protein [Candidatus Bathyarchaeota archaeon]
MKLKIGFIVASTLFLVIALFNAPLTFAQVGLWDSCQILAYGTNIEEDHEVGSFSFIAAVPPTGSEITNSIAVMDYDSGENYTIILSEGDIVLVIYDTVISMNIEVASEADHYTILFEGSADYVSINSAVIPEFPTILIIPMFMTATLLAIIYRRKRTSQPKTTD